MEHFLLVSQLGNVPCCGACGQSKSLPQAVDINLHLLLLVFVSLIILGRVTPPICEDARRQIGLTWLGSYGHTGRDLRGCRS